jgi:methenyltetrahydromethanopterin cyclohydrolase
MASNDRMLGNGWPPLGELSAPLLAGLLADSDLLRIKETRTRAGARLVDAGIIATGGLEAGRRIAELCMGGLGRAVIDSGGTAPGAPFRVKVSSSQPVLACLASQYAGWSLNSGEGEDAWRGMASGPGRARAAREPLFDELGYRDPSGSACFVLETDRPPPDSLIRDVADQCGLPEAELSFVLTPTTSLAGTVQIVARVLEVALHKAHAVGFPLVNLVDGLGTVPLPPPAPDFLAAMGRTNDAVLFGGQVQLFVTGPEDAARDLADRLPSSASHDYGRPFAELFEAAGNDFYKVDPMLFSPAEVTVTALSTGRSFTAGRLAPELLARSFGLG